MPLTCSLPSVEVLPNFREDPTSWLPSPSALTEACAVWMQHTDLQELSDMFAGMGVPALDLQVTPISVRVGCLSLQQGQAFFHHETRGRVPMPEALAPERMVWDEGTLPVWQQGVLTEPKYFSFFLDTPISPYNPNYRRKWRAHELIHATLGFFWNPQMTRFEAYMGARLDELLPIVHWYGLDEAFRPRCRKHQGRQLYRDYCPDCEALATPCTEHSAEWVESQKPLATSWFEQAWSHFSDEWQACLQELETGQKVELHRPHLNASSDAVGYLYSHWPRMTAWSFGSWVEHFLQEGVDYHSTIPNFMQRTAELSQQLVSGDCTVDNASWRRLRDRRMLQDIGYRAFVALEWLEEGSRAAQQAEFAILPLMEQGGSYSQALLTEDVAEGQLLDWSEAVCEAVATKIGKARGVPSEVTRSFRALGYTTATETSHTFLQQQQQQAESIILEGLESGAPQGWERWQKSHSTESIGRFLDSRQFQQPGRLVARFHEWYAEQPDNNPEALEWFHFEAWLHQEPLKDDTSEQFAVLPEQVSDILEQSGTLRTHSTLRIERWSAALIEEVLGESIDDEDASLAAIYRNGEPRLMLLDEPTLHCLTTLNCARPLPEDFLEQNAGTLDLLMQHAFVVWFPVPRA